MATPPRSTSTRSGPTIGMTRPSSIRASSSSQVRWRHAPAPAGLGGVGGVEGAVPGSISRRYLRGPRCALGNLSEGTAHRVPAPPTPLPDSLAPQLPSSLAPQLPSSLASPRDPEDLSRLNHDVELTLGVLPEAGDLAPGTEGRPVALIGRRRSLQAEAPDPPGAVIGVEVEPTEARGGRTAVNVAAGNGAAVGVVVVEDRQGESAPGAARGRRVAGHAP